MLSLDYRFAKNIIPPFIVSIFFIPIIIKSYDVFSIMWFLSALLCYPLILYKFSRSLMVVFIMLIYFKGVLQDISPFLDPVFVSATGLLLHSILLKNEKDKNQLQVHQVIAIKIIITFSIVSLAYFLKSVTNTQYEYSLQSIGKDLLFSLAFISIITRLNSTDDNKIIDTVLIWTTVGISVQSLLVDSYTSLGFVTFTELGRSSGILAMDQNDLARLLLILSIYFMLKINTAKNIFNGNTFALLFGFIGILVAGSRTGFLLFGMVIMLIIILNYTVNIKKIVFVTVIMLFMYIVFTFYGELISNRFQDTNVANEPRLRYVEIYISEILSNPGVLLFGANTKIVYNNIYDQSVHNVYLQILYDLGLPILLIYVFYLIKLIRLGLLVSYKNNYFYAVAAFMLFNLTVSSYNLGYLPLVISLAVPVSKKRSINGSEVR